MNLIRRRRLHLEKIEFPDQRNDGRKSYFTFRYFKDLKVLQKAVQLFIQDMPSILDHESFRIEDCTDRTYDYLITGKPFGYRKVVAALKKDELVNYYNELLCLKIPNKTS